MKRWMRWLALASVVGLLSACIVVPRPYYPGGGRGEGDGEHHHHHRDWRGSAQDAAEPVAAAEPLLTAG